MEKYNFNISKKYEIFDEIYECYQLSNNIKDEDCIKIGELDGNDQLNIEASSLKFSKLTQWLKSQIRWIKRTTQWNNRDSGIFTWEPLTNYYGLGFPILQPVRIRNNSCSNKSPLGILMKINHKQFFSQVLIEKKESQVDILFRIQFFRKKRQMPVFVKLVNKNKSQYVRTVTDDILFDGIPFGQYTIYVETDNKILNVIEFIIDQNKIIRI